MHAVLIDDMEVQRDLWSRYFGRIPGLTLQFFNNPFEAEQNIKDGILNGTVDLVITDQNLGTPIENGTPSGMDLIGNIDVFCAENGLKMPQMILVSAQDTGHLRAEMNQRGFTEIPVIRKIEIMELRRLVGELAVKNNPES